MNREKLLEAIIKVKPAIGKSQLIEQSNLIFFNKEKIATYNEDMLITINFKTEINGGVPAQELFDLLQKMNDEIIKINQKENILNISGKNIKAKINIIDSNIPDIGTISKLKKLPEDFIDGLKFCKFSVSDDPGNIMNNIQIKDNYMISSDNYRVTAYQMDILDNFLLSSKILSSLISFVPIKYNTKDNWIHFENEEKSVFSARKIEGNYPDFIPILNMKIKGKEIILPKELKNILQRTKILAEEDIVTGERIISIILKNNKLFCHGQGNVGEIDEEIEIKYKDKEITFNIVSDFLNNILDITNKVIFDNKTLIFKTKKFEHLIKISE